MAVAMTVQMAINVLVQGKQKVDTIFCDGVQHINRTYLLPFWWQVSEVFEYRHILRALSASPPLEESGVH